MHTNVTINSTCFPGLENLENIQNLQTDSVFQALDLPKTPEE